MTIVEPGASVLYDWALKVAEFAPIVFDPNIRPSVMSDRDRYQAAVEKWAAISSVIKVSDDDLAWLFPQVSIDDVAQRWIDLEDRQCGIDKADTRRHGVEKSRIIRSSCRC